MIHLIVRSTRTAWAFLLGLLLLRERTAALLFALCGIAWIIAAEWQSEHLDGNLLALGGGLCYAGVVTGLRALRGEQAAWLVFLNNIVAGLVLLPWVLTFDVSLEAVQWSVVGALSVLQMGVPYLLFAISLRSVQVSEAALITLLEAILNPIWVWLFLSETDPLSTWIGGTLILIGLVVRYTWFSPYRLSANPDG